MRLLRVGEAGAERPAVLSGDGTRAYLVGDLVGDFGPAFLVGGGPARLAEVMRNPRDLPTVDLDGVRVGPPVTRPGKLVCVGHNYASHVDETGVSRPAEPTLFLKAGHTVQGPDDPVFLPPGSERTDYEVELAVVIGATARYLGDPGQAAACIAGYTISDDVSERAFQLDRGGQWDKGKNCETFNPLGPWLVTPDDVTLPARLRCLVNGEVRQDASTADMIFDVDHLIWYISQFTVLEPGDVVNTGTPAGVGLGMDPPAYLGPGDVVELAVDGLGCQRHVLRPADDDPATAAPTTADSGELLGPDDMHRYLAGRRVIPLGTPVRGRTLVGGVSNVVIAVVGGGFAAVVKQSLPTLLTSPDWHADRSRILAEAHGLTAAGALSPGHVPGVLDVDATRFALTIECAPPDWVMWKEQLLAGRVDAKVAGHLGDLLGTWHAATRDGAGLDPSLADIETFEQLRLRPYHETTAQRTPALAGRIRACADELRSTPTCLVHGDYSPKNVLVGAGGLWVLDFEVAHVGNPVFDLAFLLTHLFGKAVRRPADAPALGQAAAEFLRRYADRSTLPAPETLYRHTGCLLLARVDGTSPLEYLTEPARRTVRALGTALLVDPPQDLDGAWLRLSHAAWRDEGS